LSLGRHWMVNGVVHHALLEPTVLMPCLNQPLSQLDHVADWSLVHSLLHHAPDAVHRVQIRAVGWPHVKSDELSGIAAQKFDRLEAPILM